MWKIFFDFIKIINVTYSIFYDFNFQFIFVSFYKLQNKIEMDIRMYLYSISNQQIKIEIYLTDRTEDISNQKTMEYSRCPNISQVEYDKAWEYVTMMKEAMEHLRGMGQDELADKMEECEIYVKNLARTQYNIRKEKKDKIPENRIPCQYCNTMVLKRGMKEHEGNKKCQAIQAENRQCAVTITTALHKKVLVAGTSTDPFAYQPDDKEVVVPAEMASKEWVFATTELGVKKITKFKPKPVKKKLTIVE